jgi:hypothetical protein
LKGRTVQWHNKHKDRRRIKLFKETKEPERTAGFAEKQKCEASIKSFPEKDCFFPK